MKSIVLMVFLFSVLAGQAQTFGEWFRQKSTQLKYLKQQIAALEAYRQVTEQGYQLIGDGAALIAVIKKGDVALHKGYFSSLEVTKPAIRGSPLVGRIKEMYSQVLFVSGEALKATKNEAVVGYFLEVLRESEGDIDWMQIVIGDGVMQLTDEERVGALSMVAERMKKRFSRALQVMKMISEVKLNGGL